MVQIKPLLEGWVQSDRCGSRVRADSVLWQGIHVCGLELENGVPRFARDLAIGHSAHWAYAIDLKNGSIEGDTSNSEWLWRPFLESMLSPSEAPVEFQTEVFQQRREVIILNCLDNMYGHCLLKLLNAQRHLDDRPDLGLIVLIPKMLRWLVPDGIAEIWTVDLGLRQMSMFHKHLHERLTQECDRFETIYLSEAYSHPSRVDLKRFAGLDPYPFGQADGMVTFIWREDRLWMHEYAAKKFRKAGMHAMALARQRVKVTRLFQAIRRAFPETRCAVAGLGCSGNFPGWIHDARVSRFDVEAERRAAELYAKSQLVIGVHGSNMLLPSGLSGMTIDLMSDSKWECLPEDILFAENDPRLATFRYRFIPLESSAKEVASVACSMIKQQAAVPRFLTEDEVLVR